MCDTKAIQISKVNYIGVDNKYRLIKQLSVYEYIRLQHFFIMLQCTGSTKMLSPYSNLCSVRPNTSSVSDGS